MLSFILMAFRRVIDCVEMRHECDPTPLGAPAPEFIAKAVGNRNVSANYRLSILQRGHPDQRICPALFEVHRKVSDQGGSWYIHRPRRVEQHRAQMLALEFD